MSGPTIAERVKAAFPAVELRTTLADLLRKQGRWEPLARHLTRSLAVLRGGDRDDKLASAFARESADIYTHKLGTPDKAITALQTALALDPTAKELRASLAIGLRIAGRLDEATALLGELIAEFGRRRAPERAPLHMELGRIRKAEGNLEEAISEVEQATKMDVSNAAYQKELAVARRHRGQLQRRGPLRLEVFARRRSAALLVEPVDERRRAGRRVEPVGLAQVGVGRREIIALTVQPGADEQQPGARRPVHVTDRFADRRLGLTELAAARERIGQRRRQLG